MNKPLNKQPTSYYDYWTYCSINLWIQFLFVASNLPSMAYIAKDGAVRWWDVLLLSFLLLLFFLGNALFVWSFLYLSGRTIEFPLLRRGFYLVALFLQAMVLAYLVLDVRLYKLMGVHLDDEAVLGILKNESVWQELQLGFTTVLLFGLIVLLLVGLQFFLFRLAWWFNQKSSFLQNKWHIKIPGLLMLVGFSFWIFLFFQMKKQESSSLSVLDAYPLSSLFSGPKVVPAHTTANYPQVGKEIQPVILQKKKNILFLQVESLRSDMLNSTHMPKTYQWMKTQNCIVSKRHYSGSHSTSWGTFSALYSLFSYHFLPFAKEEYLSVPLQLLKTNGYKMVGVSSSKLKGWDHADFMLQNFDTYKEMDQGAGYQRDNEMVDWMAQFEQKRKVEEPFFLFGFFYSTHHAYSFPEKKAIFNPFAPESFGHLIATHRLAEQNKHKVFNRYKNSVHHVDSLFQNIRTIFHKEIQKKNLAIVLVGDHGEEFWDQGLLGHGAARFNNARIQVPLVLCLPELKKTKQVKISSHVDLLPTLIDSLQPKKPIEWKQWSSGVSLLQKQDPNRFLVATGIGYPYQSKKIALIHPPYKIWLKHMPALKDFRIQKVTTLSDEPKAKKFASNRNLLLLRFQKELGRFLRFRKALFDQRPPISEKREVFFDKEIKIIGADLQANQVKSLKPLVLTTTFHVLRSKRTAHKIRFFLESSEGNFPVAELTHVPVDGMYPVEKWKKGQFIQDRFLFWIPHNFPKKGMLRLFVQIEKKSKQLIIPQCTSNKERCQKNRFLLLERKIDQNFLERLPPSLRGD